MHTIYPYMHVNATIPMACTVEYIFYWKKMEKDVDRHEQSPPFYTIQPFTRLKEQQIHTSTDSKPQAKCPYAEATAFLP